MITKRPARLRGVPYVGYQRYLLTICTAFRHRAFESAEAVDEPRLQLTQTAAQFELANIAYCFMPDHLHIVLAGKSEHADLCAFAKRFKQITSFHYNRRFKRLLWQPGYHDRILRETEPTAVVVRYVLENPIRAGLARCVGEYPYAGSDVYGLTELLVAWEQHH
jgi:putative transposase